MPARRRSNRSGSTWAALEFALRAHGDQLRKDRRTLYIVHPVGVYRRLASDLGVTDPDLLATALLHDVLEDTPTRDSTLTREFGPQVASWVAALTLPPELHGEGVPGARKTERLVRDAAEMPWEALLVKLCDRWDNLTDVANAPWGPAKRAYYRHQTRRLLETVRARWAARKPPPRWEAPLRQAVWAVERALEGSRRRPARGRPVARPRAIRGGRGGAGGRSTRPQPRAT